MDSIHLHPSAIVDEGARIGAGTRMNVFVGNRVVIGDRVKIQNNVSVYDNVTLEDDLQPEHGHRPDSTSAGVGGHLKVLPYRPLLRARDGKALRTSTFMRDQLLGFSQDDDTGDCRWHAQERR